MAKDTNKEITQVFDINLSCNSYVSYYHLQNGISPIKRLYVKNISGEDKENISVKVYSKPEFLLNQELLQEFMPRRSTVKFDGLIPLSPLYMVALDRRVQGEIFVEVYEQGKLLAETKQTVQVLAFNECNYNEKVESIATFVKRTQEINKLIALSHKKLEQWKITTKATGYNSGKNSVRNFFAACYSVLSEVGFIETSAKDENETISTFKEMLEQKVVTPLEFSLIFASMLEGNGLNPIIGYAKDKWYVGCFLIDECFNDVVLDECSIITKKLETGVHDISCIVTEDMFNGVAFEKSEKNAINYLKKLDTVEFFIDIKRARILHIMPLPTREKTENGYDLVQSKDFEYEIAPKQIKEFKGEIAGETTISRERQWERRLLEMDMRNTLLNFHVSKTVVKILTANMDEFIEQVFENKIYTVESKPNDNTEALKKITNGFDKGNYLKPIADYITYEYKNKRLRCSLSGREYDNTLLGIYRKEKTIQEESGTATLYLAVGFLKWCSASEEEDKFAPILLYPVTISKRGMASPVYTLDVNVEEVQLNSTLLEFLYQEFNLDMRGLANVTLDSSKNILSVIARIKKEVVDRKGWEVMGNIYLSTFSFTNYLMWYDVKHKIDRFKRNKITNSLMLNRLDFDTNESDMSQKSSDDAYRGDDRIYLPISADSSQYSAVYDSLSKSFVLHGPPGTGKSQTITNMIANNIVRGKRVLFVAEKMAALSVVHRRLQDIGIGDFCLELHSDKTNKVEILSHIINTLSLGEQRDNIEHDAKVHEIEQCINKIQAEIDAMHSKRYLGFSLYDAILNYFANEDAPDCLRIDSIFYEKLTETTFNKYLELLTELTLRAKECGDIDKSPFKYVGKFEYTSQWRQKAEAILDIYLLELKHLKQFAKSIMPLFNVRTVSLTRDKLNALYDICKILNNNQYIANYFKNYKSIDNAKGTVESFKEAKKRNDIMMDDYNKRYGQYPTNISVDDLKDALERRSYPRHIKKLIPYNVERSDRDVFVEFLIKCEQNRLILKKRENELANVFGIINGDSALIQQQSALLLDLYNCADMLYADCDINIFNECCKSLTQFEPSIYLEYYQNAYEKVQSASVVFNQTFYLNRKVRNEDINSTIEYLVNINKNMDYIPSWCKYQEIVDECKRNGFEFVLEPLNVGDITADDVLSCFKKCVYYNFVRSELYLDDVLCQFSGLTIEDTINKFKQLADEYEKLSREEIYHKLCAKLPRTDTVGDINLERVILMRAEKNNMKGTTIRNLFEQIPNILKATCPCMLMSPTSSTQFLDIDMDKFDLVIFDEASQVPTCKAVCSIVRGDNVVIVGDPKQLPPTTFFSNDYKDEEHYEVEDLESILDDCLALGMPERHLLWHYRSNHESLIAFSNAMFYDNTLFTFPSPNELNSKVTFHYVDGIYERGGSKCNKKEADVVIKNVIERLSDPATRGQSIGVVTFNTSQQRYIEDRLTKAIHDNGLDSVAYECEEPVFVKNLENVQGDERDVILFSVGFGPDSNGKLSLNFGPLNQNGGYKRLNVAVTRARQEMKVFSAITGNMIDLNRTESKGVKGLKAFLEYAERGREMLAIDSKNIGSKSLGIGSMIANELKDKGMLCEYDVGVSDFKIDVAVIDPRNKDKYILAIICDSENTTKLKGVKDRVAMQAKILKKLGWNTYYLWTINYFNNPKREIQKIKELITTLTEKKVMSKKIIKDIVNKYRKTYKSYYVKPLAKAGAEFVLNFVNEEAITNRIRSIIEAESPIDEQTLLDKLLVIYNVAKSSKKAVAQLNTYIEQFAGFKQVIEDKVFYVDKPIEFFRPMDTKTVRDLTKVHPEEIIAAAKCAIECNINFKKEDVIKEVYSLFGSSKKTKNVTAWIDYSIEKAIQSGAIMVTIDDYLTT